LVLFVSFLWPETGSSAAGVRTTSLLRAFHRWVGPGAFRPFARSVPVHIHTQPQWKRRRDTLVHHEQQSGNERRRGALVDYEHTACLIPDPGAWAGACTTWRARGPTSIRSASSQR
jgi:hypothetical protein